MSGELNLNIRGNDKVRCKESDCKGQRGEEKSK